MKTKKSLSFALDTDLAALRARVLRRREYLDLLETELTNTRAVIQEFAVLYKARIAPLEQEQARLRNMLDQIAADLAPPPSGWRGHGQRTKQQPGAKSHRESEPLPKKKAAASKDPDYERKIRDLFRRLAKQYHPDLAHEGKKKKLHEKIMAEINQAYMAKDLDALETLAKSHGSAAGFSNLPEAETARLSLELRQLEAMIFEIEQTIRELDLSPAMQMRSDMKDDRPGRRDILSEMEADFRARISDLQEQLIAMGVDIDIAQT